MCSAHTSAFRRFHSCRHYKGGADIGFHLCFMIGRTASCRSLGLTAIRPIGIRSGRIEFILAIGHQTFEGKLLKDSFPAKSPISHGFCQTRPINLYSLPEVYQHPFKYAGHGHIWSLVTYDHFIKPIRPSSISRIYKNIYIISFS
jgi:hypothetical protein